VMLFWGCSFQLLTVIFLFWCDIIPDFGFSPDLNTFWTNVGGSFKCFFRDDVHGCSDTWWMGMIFTVGYTVTYLCSAGLNEKSANYGFIAGTLQSPIAVFFWLLFPKINPNAGNNPLWSVIGGLALLVSASVLWKLWERNEVRKRSQGYVRVDTEIN